MKNGRQQMWLAPGDIATLVRLHGLLVGERSPLRSLLVTDERTPPETLRQRGLDQAPWRTALATLAAPTRQVRVSIPAPADSFVAIYYSSTDDQNLIGCWPEEDGLQVSFPWSKEQILALAYQTLLATAPPPADELDLTLSLPGLTALAAAVDSLRAALFRSYLYREVQVPLRLTRGGLAEQVELGLSKTDARWVVTLLLLAGSPHAAPTPLLLPEGVAELEQIGLLTRDGKDWQPSVGLQRLALQWRSPLPAFALEAMVVSADGQLQQYGHRLIIRGDGPLWQLDYGAALWQTTPQVRLSGVNPQACFDGLAHLLTDPPPVRRPAPAPVAQTVPPSADQGGWKRPCPACGYENKASARFCSNCGARLQ